jgi:lantibiotic modifying enzyme
MDGARLAEDLERTSFDTLKLRTASAERVFRGTQPFSELAWPVVVAAFGRHGLSISTNDNFLSFSTFLISGVHVPITTLAYPLERVAWLMSKPLYETFCIFRGIGVTLAALSGNRPNSGETVYKRFAMTLLETRYQTLYSEFPALFHLIDLEIKNWLTNLSYVCCRLNADGEELNRCLHFDLSCGIAEFKFGLSDPHQGGVTSIFFQTVTGQKVIYKEKPAAATLLYRDFCTLLNMRANAELLVCPKHLLFESHSWFEVLEFHTAPIDWHHFAFQSGALLFACYVLQISDCHFENVIATARGPALVDVETLGGRPKKLYINGSYATYEDSVLGTGLLATPIVVDDMAFDLSGFSKEDTRYKTSVSWTNLGKDHLVPTKSRKTAVGVNLPNNAIWDDKSINRFCEGFLATAEIVSSNFSEFHLLLDSCEEHLISRCLTRDTAEYARVISETLSPANLRMTMADWIIQLKTEVNNLPKLGQFDTEELRNQEATHLESLDIPIFTTKLPFIRGWFDRPLSDTLKALQPGLLEEQVSCIKASFLSTRSSLDENNEQ